MNSLPTNDPLYPELWHLNNTGQSGGTSGMDLDLGNVWRDYLGRGVVVGVFDEGVDFSHPDLAANVRPDLSLSTLAGDQGGGAPINALADQHGTNVAGVIAATANNALGGAGVAPGAQLASVTLNLGQSPNAQSGSDYAPGFWLAAKSYDVASNSWGVTGFLNFNSPEDAVGGQAIALAATKGRNGLGTVILFAAGNDRLEGEDSNTSNLNGSPYVISVAAVDHNGRVASYSSPGANILVAGPSQNIIYANVDTDHDGVPDSVEDSIPGDPAENPSNPIDQPGAENHLPGEDEPVQQAAGGDNPAAGGGQNGQAQASAVPAEIQEVARISNIITTANAGTGQTVNRAPGGDYDFTFGGTSAATPMVSGVVALMLEANPRLGYRDVQDILALTARNTDVSQNWTINAATDWNGGGMHVNRDVGYGLVDAHAAVRLAETWTGQNTASNEQRATAQAAPNQAIPNGGPALTSQVSVTDAIAVERAEVILDIDHPVAADLSITLTSPSGTSSLIMQTDTQGPFPSDPMSMTSTHFLGESSTGTWTLSVRDANGADASGTLKDWSLVLHGQAVSQNPTFYYTNEYQYYAQQNSARSLLDARGAVTLNASPVTSDSVINLNPGSVSRLDQTPLTVSPATSVTTYYGGDGNDIVLGNTLGDTISTGRGNDWIAPGLGASALDGGPGLDIVFFASDFLDNTFVQTGTTKSVVGPAGTDVLRNVEILAFDNLLVPVSDIAFRPTEDTPSTLLASGV